MERVSNEIQLCAGSGTNKASSETWLQTLNPSVVFISVDTGNANGDPRRTYLRG